MTSTTNARSAVAAAVFAALFLTACSSGTADGAAGTTPTTGPTTGPDAATASETPAAADVTTAVTAAMNAWADASTPADACAATSQGFGTFLGDGTYADCPVHIVETLGGALQHGAVEVSGVSLDDGQALVTATIHNVTPEPVVYYFVQEQTIWKLNSIGARRGAIG